MGESKSVITVKGVGFFGLLALIFITLKLTKAITWSWIWVLSPLWLPTGLVIGFMLFCLVMAAISALVSAASSNNKKRPKAKHERA